MDYKDVAEWSYDSTIKALEGALREPGTAYARRREVTAMLKSVPCGHSAPRAFAAWVEAKQSKLTALLG